MEAHIEDQLRDMRFKLRKEFNKSPMGGDASIGISRKDSMDWKEFDSLLKKKIEEWEEALTDDRSCWSGVMEYTVNCEAEDDDNPTEWNITVEWCMDGFDNPFWVGDEDILEDVAYQLKKQFTSDELKKLVTGKTEVRKMNPDDMEVNPYYIPNHREILKK